MTVHVERDGAVAIVTIDRPAVRNAVDGPTARELFDAFVAFDDDADALVAVLTGAHGTFCAGADLQAISRGAGNPVTEPSGEDRDLGPMGPTRLLLSKPVIAAVEGFAVAGGLELALWCDLRVVARDATFGVYCRRWGVPLIDGGTVRLPRVVGHGVAMDLVITGRGVGSDEALRIGLANRVSEPRQALGDAVAWAKEIATLPQRCLNHDRLSAYEQWSLDLPAAMYNEWRHGVEVLRSGEAIAGAARFRDGAGRHGTPA